MKTRTHALSPRGSVQKALEVLVEVLESPAGPSSCRVARTAASMGRSAGADLVIADAAVSEFHAELRAREDGIEVRDLGSLNGTWYADARLLDAFVPHGATIRLGRTLLRVSGGRLLERAPDKRRSFGPLIGESAAMQHVFEALERLSSTTLSVLLEGPTGTGKELAARALHLAGPRRAGPFVVLDCATIPGGLAETILFGQARSATRLADARPGVFEAATGGTLMLDHVGELELELQPKLLRVLAEGEVTPVGSRDRRKVDVRMVSSSSRDLRGLINRGAFREDLYFRIAGARVVLPTLSEREEDIALLAATFLERRPSGQGARSVTREALSLLRDRLFPGNVRELKNTLERASVMARGDSITPSDLAFEQMIRQPRSDELDARSAAGAVPEFKEAKRTVIDEFERNYLERLIDRCGGNLSQAAALAGVERHHLRSLLRKHGLHGKG